MATPVGLVRQMKHHNVPAWAVIIHRSPHAASFAPETEISIHMKLLYLLKLVLSLAINNTKFPYSFY